MLDTVCCASVCTGLAPPALGRPGTCQLPLQCLQPNPTGEDLNFISHQIPTRQMLVTSSPLPLSQVPMHSELGCVTPWLVAPGPWSEAELEHHARALAQAVLNNCSCNCLSAKVGVQGGVGREGGGGPGVC